MSKLSPTFTAHLFYSYSHKDSKYRKDMDDTLSLLKRGGVLTDWSDLNIVPGQSISKKIREAMASADIMVFLFSRHFIASTPCMEEWTNALRSSPPVVRIPIIVGECPWEDVLDHDDIKALPDDGKPVASFQDQDIAWKQIYNGIKMVTEELRTTYTPKDDHIHEIEAVEFPSTRQIKLQDTFVFPSLLSYGRTKGGQIRESIIGNTEDLLRKRHVIIQGPELSGKTTLLRYIYLSLIRKSAPVLMVDLQTLPAGSFERFILSSFRRQFRGDYSQWKKQEEKTLVIDNLSSSARGCEFLLQSIDYFDTVIVSCPKDLFNAYYSDDDRFNRFLAVEIQPLDSSQQESLIRKRLAGANENETITDGQVDQVERQVNSVVVSKKIFPRYPFFILSIVQSHEAFMPEVSITSYGHCYYVLIFSYLVKSGIPRADAGINVSFQFATHLAFFIFEQNQNISLDKFNAFVNSYQVQYFLPQWILNRLQSDEYGIITPDGSFKTQYMYFYFLGRSLSRYSTDCKDIVQRMCDRPHVKVNYLTLLFLIHHSDDNWVIEDIVLRVMCEFDFFVARTS